MRKPIVKNIRTRQDVNFIKKSLFSVPNINRRGEKEGTLEEANREGVDRATTAASDDMDGGKEAED